MTFDKNCIYVDLQIYAKLVSFQDCCYFVSFWFLASGFSAVIIELFHNCKNIFTNCHLNPVDYFIQFLICSPNVKAL